MKSIHGKNRQIYGQYSFWTPIKNNISEVWNWNSWTFYCLEVEVGGHGPPVPLSGYAPVLTYEKAQKQPRFYFNKFLNWIIFVCQYR